MNNQKTNREFQNGWISTYVGDKYVRQNFMGTTMDFVYDFENGIAQATRQEGLVMAYYIVTDHGDVLKNIPQEKFDSAFKIAREPAKFLEMPTRYFEDKGLVDDLLLIAKNSLKNDIEKAGGVSEEYLEYVRDLSAQFGEKMKRENEKLREIGMEEIANKNEALDIIKDMGKVL